MTNWARTAASISPNTAKCAHMDSMVGDPGLEPGWVTPHAPQTCASTSSASRPAVSRLILPVVRHSQRSRDGGPVARGRGDAERLRREPFQERRATDAVRVPRVDLAADDRERLLPCHLRDVVGKAAGKLIR